MLTDMNIIGLPDHMGHGQTHAAGDDPGRDIQHYSLQAIPRLILLPAAPINHHSDKTLRNQDDHQRHNRCNYYSVNMHIHG